MSSRSVNAGSLVTGAVTFVIIEMMFFVAYLEVADGGALDAFLADGVSVSETLTFVTSSPDRLVVLVVIAVLFGLVLWKGEPVENSSAGGGGRHRDEAVIDDFGDDDGGGGGGGDGGGGGGDGGGGE